MDVKVLDGSVFKNGIRTEFWFSAHPYQKGRVIATMSLRPVPRQN